MDVGMKIGRYGWSKLIFRRLAFVQQGVLRGIQLNDNQLTVWDDGAPPTWTKNLATTQRVAQASSIPCVQKRKNSDADTSTINVGIKSISLML